MPGLIPILGGASLFYLAMAPRLNKLVYRPLLFFPVAFPDIEDVPSINEIPGEEVYFSGASGQTLHGWYWRNPEERYTFLISHGNSGNLTIRLDLCRNLFEAGCSVMVYDYQGFGRSTGLPCVKGICSDSVQAYDFLVREKGVENQKILLYGESLGAAVSTYLSTQRECSAMVLQSGFSSLHKIAREHFPVLTVYPDSLFPKPTLDSLSILKRPHPPVLFLHGAQDTVIPIEHSIEMYEAAVGRKQFLKLPFSSHANVWSSSSGLANDALSAFIEQIH